MPTPSRSEPERTGSSSYRRARQSLPSTTSSHSSGPITTTRSANMSTLGYAMPNQYHHFGVDDPAYASQTYNQHQSYNMPSHPPSRTPGYDLSFSGGAYGAAPFRSSSSSQAPQYYGQGSGLQMYGGGYAPAPGQLSRSMSSPMHAAILPSNHPTYPPTFERSPSLYEPGAYGSPMSSAQTLPSQSPVPPIYSPQLSQTSDPPRTIPRSMSTVSSGSTGRQHNPKTKPQCWEHGCNGREFSTFSNLLRHQREKGGTATKASCPRCGAEFTRTTARNGHMAHDKCTRQPRPSESH